MIIVICGIKGGSGKTTAATNIACEYSKRSFSTLLVDADKQGTVRTWANIASESDHEGPVVVAMGEHLHKDLPKVAKHYDRVIVDCPPQDGLITRGALLVADMAILPCRPSPNDIWALQQTVLIVKEAQQVKPQLNAFVLVSQVDKRTVVGTQVRESLSKCSLPLLKTTLGYRVAYVEAQGVGQGVIQYAGRSESAKEIRKLTKEIEKLSSSEVKKNAA